MFRPIKNFLNYIQNNTNSTSIFGGATETLATSAKESKRETSIEVFESDIIKLAGEAKMNVRKLMASKQNAAINLPAPTAVRLADTDVDDIETQIKSSMVRNPLKTYKSTHLDAYSQNHADSCDEFGDLLLETVSVADSEEELDRKVSVAEEGLGTEEPEILVSEEEESNFLNLATHGLDALPNNELIVLDENELNNSMNSDLFCEDPLAIDEFIVPESSFVHETLDSSKSQNDEDATDDLWINIDDIKSCDKSHNLQENACEESRPSITPTITEKHEDHIVIDVVKSDVLNKSAHARNEDDHPEELRNEGSDSGLGSETSNLQITINSTNGTPTRTPTNNEVDSSSSIASTNLALTETILSMPTADGPSSTKKPIRSNLKRRLIETEEDTLDSTGSTAHSPLVHLAVALQKKSKRSINFNQVQVFYFQRQQGFGCVPSAGGCTLGMAPNHVSFKTLTLAEHAAELRRAHRQQLQEVSPRGTGGSSSDDSEESEEDYLSEGSGSDADAESSGFLQPVSPKQRRALLKAAGVRKIDANEKVECRDIRNSREVCGCTCRDFCDPETCACSQAGIKCQVDRAMFPCGCSREGCGNTVGRVEFNPSRVRTHFIHTIMRLEMESRQQQKPNLVMGLGYDDSAVSASSSSSVNQISSNYYSMQPPQSNYSSGYASPSYPPIEQTSPQAYYQQQAQQLYDVEALQNSASLNQAPQQAYQVDGCLDTSLLLGGTPSYGELMPSFGNDIHAPLCYPNVSNGIITEATVPYSSYTQVAPSPNYLSINAATTNTNSSFSSCAVPSAPPYGPAMTTAASSTQYHSSNSVSGCDLETSLVTSPSPVSINNCSSLENASNFISLNSPISSSSRLSVINDLLQHNRNTTAALVAVSHTTSGVAQSALCNSNADPSITSSSIGVPPILAFDGIAPSLSPMPLVAILGEPERLCNTSDIAGDEVLAKSPQTELQPVVVAALPVDRIAKAATN